MSLAKAAQILASYNVNKEQGNLARLFIFAINSGIGAIRRASGQSLIKNL